MRIFLTAHEVHYRYPLSLLEGRAFLSFLLLHYLPIEPHSCLLAVGVRPDPPLTNHAKGDRTRGVLLLPPETRGVMTMRIINLEKRAAAVLQLRRYPCSPIDLRKP